MIKSSEERWPELDKVARELADSVCFQINQRAASIDSETPYKAQGVLEMLIRKLEDRV